MSDKPTYDSGPSRPEQTQALEGESVAHARTEYSVPSVHGPPSVASAHDNYEPASTVGGRSHRRPAQTEALDGRSAATTPGHSGRRSKRFAATSDELIGQVLASYRIIKLLGEGGMGQVYEAEHVKLGRRVALKLLRPEYAVKRDSVHRFFQEARAVNAIGHENIVDITDYVELESGETFFIMELLQGEDLSDMLKRRGRPLPLHQAMQIALQVCDALTAAHDKGIIHRDLKPDNIFIVNSASKRNFVKLLDFGVAKLFGDASADASYKTAAGSVIGTPAYMSPEQATGIPVDQRSDIYSFGAILYELFTGQPVFRAKSFGEYVVKHMNDIPIPPRDLSNAPKVPAPLERVIMSCLEKDPNKRYPSAAELREDLYRATATVNTVLEARGQSHRGSPSKGSMGTKIFMGLLVLIAAGASFWFAAGLTLDDILPGDKSQTAAAAPQVTKLVSIRVTTEPDGAEVFRRGQRLGRTPLTLELPAGEQVKLVMRKKGFDDHEESFRVGDTNLLNTQLVARAKPQAVAVTQAANKIAKPTAKIGSKRPKIRRGKRPHTGKKPVPAKTKPVKQPTKTVKQPDPPQKPGKIDPEHTLDPFAQ